MKNIQKALKIEQVLNRAYEKKEVIEHSNYYEVFGTQTEKTNDLISITKAIYRLQAYYYNTLINALNTKNND